MSFGSLPESVRTAGFAAAMGVMIDHDTTGPASFEACGSPGEIASDPKLDARFYYGSMRFTLPAELTEQEVLSNYRLKSGDSSTIFAAYTMAALYQPDQLRQRVAWGLSQIVVAAKSFGGLGMDGRDK